MDLKRIQTILLASSSSILSANTFSDRMTTVGSLLEKAFPGSSMLSAIWGPMQSLGDFMERTEIEPLLRVIAESSHSGCKYWTTDESINEALGFIYGIVEQD